MTHIVERPHVGPLIGCVKRGCLRVWIKAEPPPVGQALAGVVQLYRHDEAEPLRSEVFNFQVGGFDKFGMFDLAGLNDDTAYQYRVGVVAYSPGARPDPSDAFDWSRVNEAPIDGWPSVRTFPPRSKKCIQFLAGSCNYSEPSRTIHKFFKKMFEIVGHPMDARKACDFFLSMGDLVYADLTKAVLPSKPPKDPGALEERYDQTLRVDYFRQFMQGLPLVAIYDDHEISNDWSWGLYQAEAKKQPSRKILEAGLRQFAMHFGALAPNPAVATVDGAIHHAQTNLRPDDTIAKNWYNFEYGTHDFFVSDVRGQRSKPEPGGTLLGQDQLTDLISWIAKDTPGLKFWVSPVPLFPDTRFFPASPDDVWTGFAEERLFLLEAIRAAGATAERLVVLSGDVHVSGIARAVYEGGHNHTGPKIYNVISSGLSWAFGLQKLNFRTGKLLYSRYNGKKGKGEIPYRADWVNIEDQSGRDHTIIKGSNFARIAVSEEADAYALRINFHQDGDVSDVIGKTLRFPK